MIETYEEATPTKTINTNNKGTYTISKPILEFKNKYRQLYQSTRAYIYKNLCNNANNRLKRKINELKSIKWNSLCKLETNNGTNLAAMWKKIRALEWGKTSKPLLLPGIKSTRKS